MRVHLLDLVKEIYEVAKDIGAFQVKNLKEYLEKKFKTKIDRNYIYTLLNVTTSRYPIKFQKKVSKTGDFIYIVMHLDQHLKKHQMKLFLEV